MKYQELNKDTIQKIFRSDSWFKEWDQLFGESFRYQLHSMKIESRRHIKMTISQNIISTIRFKILNSFNSDSNDLELEIHLELRLASWGCSVKPSGFEKGLITANDNTEWAWDVVPERQEIWIEPCIMLNVSLKDCDVSVDFIGRREWINARTNYLLSIKRWIHNYGTLQEDGNFKMGFGIKYIIRRFLKQLPISTNDDNPLAVVIDGYVGQTSELEVFRGDGTLYSFAEMTKMILAWMRCCDAQRNRPYANYDKQLMDRNARFSFKYFKENLTINVRDSVLEKESLIVARFEKLEYVGFVRYQGGERDGVYSGEIRDIGSRKYYPDGSWK